VFEQTPVLGLHASTVQSIPSEQLTLIVLQAPFEGLQVALSQAEVGVQATGVETHPIVSLQEAIVHLLLLTQEIGATTQVPVEGLHVLV